MTRIGYIWVGALEHSADYQRSLLVNRGASTMFEDVSGNSATPRRPQLTAALDRIGAGDTLVVWRLDRLGSSTQNVLTLLELLGRKGVGVVSLAEKLDTSAPAGTTFLTFVTAVNELERCLLRERTMVGVYAARARGRVAGRPRALSATNIERVALLRDQGASVREIAEQIGTSRATVYRALESVSEPRDSIVEDSERSTIVMRLPAINDSTMNPVPES